MKVLVVEDVEGHAVLVREQLEAVAPGEFEVSVVGTLAETVDLLLGAGRPPIDCVLLDLGLPDAGGLQTLDRVRTAALDAPVVVHSGLDDDDLAQACVRAGAQDYLVKGRAGGCELARVLRHAVVRKRRENELARRALHDPLTALPNRTLFRDRLRQALNRLGRTDTRLAVMFCDLDGFKAVNDAHGHAAGDELLCEVAVRLVATLRGGDTAARLGGDEFVVLCEDVAGAEEAEQIARRLLEVLPVRASIGVRVVTDAGAPPGDVLRDADAAMYAVKRRGGGDVALWGGAGGPAGA